MKKLLRLVSIIVIGTLIYVPQMVLSQEELSLESLRGDHPIKDISIIAKWKRVPAKWSDIFVETQSSVFTYSPNQEQKFLIRHSIDGYKINRNFVKCLSCHGNMLCEMTSSDNHHFKSKNRDCENQENYRIENLDSRYFLCTQCHVPQASVEPLRENTFKSAND
jgi:cytochrome c-type protein NapB